MYHAMVKHISVDSTVLLDPQTAPAEIDRCLTSMMQQSRPVYIGVPVDMSHLECDASALRTAIPRALSPNDPQLEKEVVGKLRKMMELSKNPIIIVDGFAARNNLQDQCRELSELTGFPTFNTYMGKGCIDEAMPNFGGLYTGAGTYEGVKKAVESANAVFWIGNVQVCPMRVHCWRLSDNHRPTSIPASSPIRCLRT
jgi:pyruvate decarboxylase